MVSKVGDAVDPSFNFTHRAAFGDIGEGDKHGNFKTLADSTLERL